MERTENSQQSQLKDSLFWRMLNRHSQELKVGVVNLAAAMISASEFEQTIRLIGMTAAAVYTIVKIVQTVKEISRESRKDKQNELR